MKKVTIHDVAKQAGVSPATVSRVLNGTAKVKPDKAEQVQKVIAELGYRPNALAHSLAQGKGSGTVGVIVRHLYGEFFSLVLSAFENELRAKGLHMICSSSNGSAQEERQSLKIMTQRGVEALFLMAPCLPDAELLELIGTTPTVLMNRYIPELARSCVTIDNRLGGYLATKHLLDLGHERIACITAYLTRQFARQRLEGYLEALREKGIARDDLLIIEADDLYSESGTQATERLLKLGSFSALFATNDLMAAGALKALQAHAYSVPEDVSIIGFDDLSLCQLTTPTLSTMHYPTEEMGKCAAQHLLQQMEGKAPDTLSPFKSYLKIRESSAAPKGQTSPVKPLVES
ncbi:MAG: LacI family DNA-binding transcriptional regulator [Trueperaceae bacterium]|nr:LacI family DNA-binding transcriptional regulator [Trueperaceae bacterium]